MKKNVLALSLFLALSVSVVSTSHAYYVWEPFWARRTYVIYGDRPTGFDYFMQMMSRMSPRGRLALVGSLGVGAAAWMLIYGLLPAEFDSCS